MWARVEQAILMKSKTEPALTVAGEAVANGTAATTAPVVQATMVHF